MTFISLRGHLPAFNQKTRMISVVNFLFLNKLYSHLNCSLILHTVIYIYGRKEGGYQRDQCKTGNRALSHAIPGETATKPQRNGVAYPFRCGFVAVPLKRNAEIHMMISDWSALASALRQLIFPSRVCQFSHSNFQNSSAFSVMKYCEISAIACMKCSDK